MAAKTEFPSVDIADSYMYSYSYELKFYDPDNSEIKISPIKIKLVEKNVDYIGKFMPIIKIRFTILKTDMFILKKNQKTLLATLTRKFNKYVRLSSDQQAGEKTSSLSESSIEFSGSFEPIFAPDAFDERFREDEYVSKEKQSSETETNVETETNQIAINVVLMDLIATKSMKSVINMVVKAGSTVGTILQYIADYLPINHALIDMPDNTNTLPDAIIAPGALVATLNYIQSTFGVYENGFTAFYDDDVLYFLNKYSLEHDCKSGDKTVTHIYVTEIDLLPGGVTICALNNDGEPMYLGPIVVTTVDTEVMDGEIFGNNFIFSSFRQGLDAVSYKDGKVDSSTVKPVASVLTRNVSTHAHSGDKSVLDYDELNNPFNMASYFNELEASSKIMTVQLNNFNMDHFRANKLLHLHYLDQNKDLRLGGLYHIRHVLTVNVEMKNHVSEMTCGGVITISHRSKEISSQT